ncbi:tetratricopeptide repeat protein [Polynucleobacter sp. AP-Sanab-80-C2]|jgi:tetratricopeptide (TPR) repeat protein|uniref:tetratricopeptide repeat protein n=1 Tax=Polynucleobacter sp. AP-Sanab-80-C2 TaxID=3108274 RepID=UPI002B224285|nr:tetratricopeptide repeat protein [Polynucleobacter sp. AP-Sanab-80-C2]MEA9600423.1 tetratricopeptide repeat protein [Polynucleobacter sp. AP-Sanab-80-C2]
MKMRNLINVLAGLFAAAVLLASNPVFAEASLPEIYQAVQSGQLAKADAMMKEVLQNHPNSAKAHYVAAELYLKEGKLDAARNHFVKAENLAPGLPFAQPESVQKLQVQLASGAVGPAAAQGSIFSNPIFWGLIAILVVGIIIVMRRRKAEAVQVYNAPSAGYPGTPGGPPAGYPGGPGYPGAPAAGGMGSGLMGSLATGAALGAGMVAGQALANNLMGGHDGGHSSANPNPNLTQVGGPASLDPNFGVNDASSWDDGGSSSWDDGGGDFMSDV